MDGIIDVATLGNNGQVKSYNGALSQSCQLAVSDPPFVD